MPPKITRLQIGPQKAALVAVKVDKRQAEAQVVVVGV